MGILEKDKTTRYLNYLMGLLGIFMLIGLVVSCMNRSSGNTGFYIDQGKRIDTVFDVRWGQQELHTTLPATIDNLYLAIFILVISTILELINFLFISKENSGTILIIGMTLFILKAGIDLIIEGRQLRKDDLEKEVLRTMAYTDGLTHLENRFAYDLEKDRLERQKDSHVTILIADMNGLKQANDNYGHAYGDQVICETAEVLKVAFANVGKCYRIGGDEFCVVAENVNEILFQKCIKNMKEKTTELRTHVNDYGIAYGVASGSSQEIEDIFHRADNLMYACKKEMKKTKM